MVNNAHSICDAISLGCTPLHWAAIRGNAEVCNVLVQAGTKQELIVKDKSGLTPVQLASDRGQKHAAIILVSTYLHALCSIF